LLASPSGQRHLPRAQAGVYEWARPPQYPSPATLDDLHQAALPLEHRSPPTVGIARSAKCFHKLVLRALSVVSTRVRRVKAITLVVRSSTRWALLFDAEWIITLFRSRGTG